MRNPTPNLPQPRVLVYVQFRFRRSFIEYLTCMVKLKVQILLILVNIDDLLIYASRRYTNVNKKIHIYN